MEIDSKQKLRIAIVGLLLVGAGLITHYYDIVLKNQVVFTHFFYIPIVISALWWKRKGTVVAVFLAGFLLLSNLLWRGGNLFINDCFRAAFFVAIAFVVAILAEEVEAKCRKIQTNIKESEQSFRQLFDNANDGLIVADGQTKQYLMCNKMICKMLGYSEEELLRLGLKDVHSENDLPRAIKEFDKLLGEDTILVEAMPMQRKDGSVFLADIVGSKIIISGKEYLMGSFRDISERKEAEKKLHNAEFRYRTVADFTYDLEYWQGPEGDFRYISPSCERITGYKPQEFIEDPELLGKIIIEEDKALWLEHRRRACHKPLLRQLQFRIRKKDGEIRWIEHICRPVEADDGSFLGCRGSSRDITKRKSAESQLGQLRRELIHSTRAMSMGELTAALAHELNQPLAAIMSNAQAAQRFLSFEKPDMVEVRHILADIVRDDNRAKEIILKIRSMMRKSKPEFKELNLNEVIKDVMPIIRSDSIIRNVNLSLELKDDILPVWADRVQLQQVVFNLVLNSFEAMAETSTKKVCISTDYDLAQKNVRAAVKDAGTGFDEEKLEHAFTPFATTKKEGLGMGLAICRTIIEAHGGRIWAENNVDKGAAVHFTIPVNKKETA